MNYRTFMPHKGSEQLAEIRNQREIPIVGYAVGAHVGYRLNNALSLEAGLQYALRGHTTKLVYFNPAQPEWYLPGYGRTSYEYQYLDLPVRVNYRIGKGRLGLNLGAGVAMSYLLDLKFILSADYQGATYSKTSSVVKDMNRFNLFPFLSVGLDCRLNQNMFFRLEPIGRIGVLKTNSGPLGDVLYSLGLNFGFYAGF